MSRVLTVLLAAVLLVAGCTRTNDGAVTAHGSRSVSGYPGAPDTVVTPFDGDVDPMRVLLAVVVLTTGNVDAAVAEGLLTPAEFDIAESAIANHEVSAWLARADLALNGG